MGKTSQVGADLRQQSLAVTLTVLWLIAGILPGLHLHDPAVDAHGHDPGSTASMHPETPKTAHPEACGLCAKMLSFEGLERPQATSAGEHYAERAGQIADIQPPSFSGRHGASRAPPS